MNDRDDVVPREGLLKVAILFDDAVVVGGCFVHVALVVISRSLRAFEKMVDGSGNDEMG